MNHWLGLRNNMALIKIFLQKTKSQSSDELRIGGKILLAGKIHSFTLPTNGAADKRSPLDSPFRFRERQRERE